MDKDEVLRRLRLYYAMPPANRHPLSWQKLAEACGERGSSLYTITAGTRPLTERMAKRIARVLQLIEEGRIAYVRDPTARYRKGRFLVAENVPTPKAIRRTITISNRGARLVTEVVNPMSFPQAPGLFRRVP